MRFNKQAVQHELDLAAEELDKSGYKDLADKVDYYNSRLANASETELPLIRRSLSRIQSEAQNRIAKVEANEKKEESKDSLKAKLATLRVRRASEKRKAALRKLVNERKASKTKAGKVIANLRTRSMDKREGNVQLRRARLRRLIQKNVK
jgi:hypothetical protein